MQTVELLAKAYFVQHGRYVASQVFPGPRAKSAPVVTYLKVSDRPISGCSANYRPTEVLVFWDGLLDIARHQSHGAVTDAIGRVRAGLFLINSTLRPADLQLPFAFCGTVATVDADAIVKRLLRRDPPPVGAALMGAYAAVTGGLDLALLEDLVRERFGGDAGRKNAEALREAAATVQVARDLDSGTTRTVAEPVPVDPESLPEWFPIERETMRGFTRGGAAIWRTKIPVSNDTQCLCKDVCLSEVLCPDNTGFIVRAGLEHQGYRIDTDFCRGCGICVEVCVYGALRMVREREVLATNPTYEGIGVGALVRART